MVVVTPVDGTSEGTRVVVMAAGEVAVVTDRLPRKPTEITPDSKMDLTLSGIVDRGVRSIYLNHAKERGVKPEEIEEYEKLSTQGLVQVVTLLWGDPKSVKMMVDSINKPD